MEFNLGPFTEDMEDIDISSIEDETGCN